MPSQLVPRQISKQFRALLWAEIHGRLEATKRKESGSYTFLSRTWEEILKDSHVQRDHLPVDEFASKYYEAVKLLKPRINAGPWSDVLGWLEFVFKHAKCPSDFPRAVDKIMADSRLAYRVFDDLVICPIGSEEERQSITKAFADLGASQFQGARVHLRNASQSLTAGEFADSVRESIHAVEATARVLEPSAALSSALSRLEHNAKIHRAMKHGFTSLYGYTSDEKGIRHPLLDDGTAGVDEADVLFMIGACASFVSYLINKARIEGILKS
jgi:hypothetical protein